MNYHTRNNTIYKRNVLASEWCAQELLKHEPVQTLMSSMTPAAQAQWREQPIYQRLCTDRAYHDTNGFFILDDGTLGDQYLAPGTYRNFDTRQEAEAYLRPSAGNARARPVLCLDTGVIYDSMMAAATSAGLTPASISNAVRTGRSAGGRRYADPSQITPPPPVTVSKRLAPVLCLDTGITYPSMTEAAIAHGIDLPALSRALRFSKPLRSNTMDKKISFMRM